MHIDFPPGDTFDPETVTWVMDDGALEILREAISSGLVTIMDLETTGLDEHERGLLEIQELSRDGEPATDALVRVLDPALAGFDANVEATRRCQEFELVIL